MPASRRYHISRATGRPVRCRANKRVCPFAADGQHYDTRQQALDSALRQLADAHRERAAATPLPLGDFPAPLRVSSDSVMAPKGLYLLCDPELSIGQDPESYQTFIDAIHERPRREHVSAFYLGNHPVVALRALSVDTPAVDDMGREYPLQSGYLTLVPLTLLPRLGVDRGSVKELGTLVSFGSTTEVSYDSGVLSLGPHLDVNTDTAPEGEAILLSDEELLAGPGDSYLEATFVAD